MPWQEYGVKGIYSYSEVNCIRCVLLQLKGILMADQLKSSGNGFAIGIAKMTISYVVLCSLAVLLPLSSDDPCALVNSINKGVYRTFANQIWSLIIIDVISLYFTAQFFFSELPNGQRIGDKIWFDEEIHGGKLFRISVANYANAKTRILFLYPCAILVFLFAFVSLLRCH